MLLGSIETTVVSTLMLIHSDEVPVPTLHQLSELSEDESCSTNRCTITNEDDSDYEGISSSTPQRFIKVN